VETAEALPPPLPPIEETPGITEPIPEPIPELSPEGNVESETEATPPPLPDEPVAAVETNVPTPQAAATVKLKDAAEALGLPVKEVLRLTKAHVPGNPRTLEGEKRGNNWFFAPEEIARFQADRDSLASPKLEKLQAVASNTATDEDFAELAKDGLVETHRGERVITNKGYDLMAKAGTPPRLTRKERIEEIDAQLGPVEKPLDLNPRVKKVGKLYVVRQPSGDSIPANVSMADDRAAREEANRIAAEFDRIDAEREAALEAQRAEEKSRREAEEALEADQELAPKFQALLSNTLYDYRKARERGASNPEAEEAFTRQLVAIGKKLGMRNLHPGLLAMHLVRPPVGPLLVKQAQAISGVQEMLQDATREIAPGTLSLREGLSSPAGFLGLDQSPLSWGQMIQLGALTYEALPNGNLRIRSGKTPEDIKADQSDTAAQEYYDQLKTETEEAAIEMERQSSPTGYELLDAVVEAGGLPSPKSQAAESHRGELKLLYEGAAATGRGAYKGKAITNFQRNKLFSRDAQDLDSLAARLREHGFAVETPSDVLDLIDQRLTSGRPMYGTAVSIDDGMGERFAATKPRVRLANAEVTTEPGILFVKRAHHGTPHKVDRFSLEKIGSGEGAQAYGWGLYFAENQSVADDYRNNLSDGRPLLKVDGQWKAPSASDPLSMAAFDAAQKNFDYEQLQKEAEENVAYWTNKTPNKNFSKEDLAESAKQARERLEAIKELRSKTQDAPLDISVGGNLYTVDLDVEPEDMLDWDKPLSEQSEKVQAALAEMNPDYRPDSDEYDANEQGQITYTRITSDQARFGGINPEMMASVTLRDYGIKGIRYLDGGSRSDGQGTYNYVVFDENLIRIVAENGQEIGNATVLSAKPTAAQRASAKAYTEANGSQPADVAEDAVAMQLAQVASPFRQTTYQLDLFNRPAPANEPVEVTEDEYDQLVERGLAGDWKALANAVAMRGRASAILPQLVDSTIPAWNPVGTKITETKDFAALMMPIRSPYHEMIKVAVLDDDLNIVSAQIVSVGSLNEAMAHPRNVLGFLARVSERYGKKYENIIISHNHPSGDPTPSQADYRVQKNFEELASALDFNLIDHVITNGTKYYSLKGFGSGSFETPTQAEWEKVSFDTLATAELPFQFAAIAKELSQSNPDAGHIVYLNTKLRVLAVEQFNKKNPTAQELGQQIFQTVSREGAYAFTVLLPTLKGAGVDPGFAQGRLVQQLREVTGRMQVTFIDAVKEDGSNYFSFKEAGLLEEPATYLAAKPRQAQQLDLFADSYNQTAKPWTPSWQAKADTKVENAPELKLEKQTENTARIEDFGEKIEGARKDLWQKYTDAIMADLPEDSADITLAKFLPEPDYEAMLASGMEPRRVAAVRALRDLIPRKPSTGWKLRRWTEGLISTRTIIQRLVEPTNPISIERFNAILADSPEMRDQVDLYDALGYPLMLEAKGWKLRQKQGYTTFNGQPTKASDIVSYMEKDYRMDWNLTSVVPDGDWRRGYSQTLEKFRDQLQAKAAKPAEAKKIDFQFYSDRTTGDIFIGKKGASGVIRLKPGFKSVKEASNWLTDNYDNLRFQWEEMRKEPILRKALNDPRTGPARREGDVSPEMFTEAFGFRGVQFGNYVEGERRQRDLNNAFDALMDLAETLNVPTKALSLDGALGMAFGARGTGGKRPAAAHYEPGQVVINLTKNAGPGSLAHEWFHALDNYFARVERTGSTAPREVDEYATDSIRNPKNVRPAVMDAFRAIRNAVGTGTFAERSKRLDATRSTPYYGTTIEKAARAFEVYVVDRLAKSSVTNDYLANIDFSGDAYPFPQEMEGGIRQAYDVLFNTLDTRETDQGVALFAKARRLNLNQEITPVPITRQLAGLPKREASNRILPVLREYQKLRGDELPYNADLQRRVGFSGSTTGKLASYATHSLDDMELAFALPQIVESAALVETNPDKKNNPDVSAVHRLVTAVNIDGEIYPVKITVIERRNGTLLYDAVTKKSEVRASAVQAPEGTSTATTNLNPKLADLIEAFNLNFDGSQPLFAKSRRSLDTTSELFGDETPFNLVGETLPPAPVKADTVVDAQAREEAFRKSGREDVEDLFGDASSPAPSPTATEFGFTREIDAPIEKIKKDMVRFASGMSGISDLATSTFVRGGMQNYGVGFDVGLLSKNAIEALANAVVNLDAQVFIDSGAFSHFIKSQKAEEKGITLKPLSFDKIFEKYDSILDAIQKENAVEKDYPSPLMVMPDIIGNQKASLLLTDKYKDRIAVETEAQALTPIIPIPLGELSLAQAYNKILEILNSNSKGITIDPSKFIVGIPSNAQAVSREKLAEFLSEAKPPRIHFLGAAADVNINPLLAVVAKSAPDTMVTADASKVRSEILNGVAAGKTREQAITDALFQEDDPSAVLENFSREIASVEDSSKPSTPSLFTQPATDQGTLFDIGPVGPRTLTQAEAAKTISKQKAAEVLAGSNLSDRPISTYEQAVAANNAHMGTKASEWTAVPIEEVVITDQGPMPQYDAKLTAAYSGAPTLFPGDMTSPACQWCGKQPVRRLYKIKHDAKKYTLMAGSECFTHFQEDSGDKMLQSTKSAQNLEKLKVALDAISELNKEFRRSRTDSYGRPSTSWYSEDARILRDKLKEAIGKIDAESGPAAITRWVNTKGKDAAELMEQFAVFMAEPKTKNLQIKARDLDLQSVNNDLKYRAQQLPDYKIESLNRQKEKLESEIAELSGATILGAKPVRDITKRNEAVQKAANDYAERKITLDDYLAVVRAEMPYAKMESVPEPATRADMDALTEDKRGRIFVPSKLLKGGERVGLRLDIPAYRDHGTWIVAIHEPRSTASAGKSLGYESVAMVRNASFESNADAALNIARGLKPKSTIATIEGEWATITPDEAKTRAEEAMNDSEWVQVGMNPFRHSWFYNRATGAPVVSASEVLQVGGLVLAKNPVYTTADDRRFMGNKSGVLFAKSRPARILAETKGKVVAGTAVGTRNPTGKNPDGSGTDASMLVGLDAMRQDPALFRKNAMLLADYPLVAGRVPEAAALARKVRAPLVRAQARLEIKTDEHKKAREALQVELARQQGVRKAKVKMAAVDAAIEAKPDENSRKVRGLVSRITAARTAAEKAKTEVDVAKKAFDNEVKAILANERRFPTSMAESVYQALTEMAVDNLERLIELFPADLRDIARLWYDGANIIAQDFATRFGTTLNRSAAVLAVFSPQKDWFMNVALAERMMNVWRNHQDTIFDDAMAAQYIRRSGEPQPQWDKKLDDYKRDAQGNILYEKGAKPVTNDAGDIVDWENWDNTKAREKLEEAKADIEKLKGKKLKDLPLKWQARFIRMWSEVYDSPSFPVVSPDGRFGDPMLTEKGEPRSIAWGSYNTIEKAINILSAPAEAEMQTISAELGVQHKVRSFYNNIVDPANPDGHVTMDTHAIAAILWQALSGNSPEVSQNFGQGGAAGNANLGISGLYPAFAEAYRIVAKDFNLLPREVQSITWEAVRLLFPAKFKSQKANVNKVRAIWKKHEQGIITTKEAHDLIFRLTDEWSNRDTLQGRRGKTASEAIADGSGVGRPDWAAVAGNRVNNTGRQAQANDAGELPADGGTRSGTGRPAGGRGGAGRASRVVPATPEGGQPRAVLGAKARPTKGYGAEPWRLTKREFFHPQISRKFIEAADSPDGTLIGTIGDVVHGAKTRRLLDAVLDVPIMILRYPVQGGKRVPTGKDFTFDGASGNFNGKPAIFINPNEKMVGTLWEESAHQMRAAKGRPIRKTDISKLINDDNFFDNEYQNDPEEVSAKKMREYLGSLASKEKSHEEIVADAVAAGLPVPENVLAEYPTILSAKPSSKRRPALPPMEQRIEASLDQIEQWGNVLRAAEEKPAGSVQKLANAIREEMPNDLWKGYQYLFRGRLDRADALAPGVKGILQAAQQEEALAQLGVNAVVDGLRRELQKAFGDPSFWNKNRARLKEATRMLLPVASYLQPESAGLDGGFVWRDFERRSGTISQKQATELRLKMGEWFQMDGRTYRLGEYLQDEKQFTLLEPISAEQQQAIYEEFWKEFPEALPILDRWITPDLKDAYTVGEGATMGVEFNREALLNFYNAWPENLRNLWGDMPLAEVPRVDGYTPDIAAQRGIIAMIARLLGKYKSPGRKFKSGALREAGNVKNLVDGFSTRAMEAHREKIRMRMREGIIEKAVVLREDVPAEFLADYIALEDVYSSIVKAVEAARLLDKKSYPHLSKALNPKDQVQLMKLVGDAARLNSIEQMIHRDVYRELMLSMARAQTENMLLKLANFFLRAKKLGVLTAGSVGINWLGNEILKLTQALNRLNYGLALMLVADSKGAKVNILEALYLLRGLITDRAPNTLNQQRIADILPRELFDNTTALASLDAGVNYGNLIDDIKRNGVLRGPAQGMVNAFKQGGVSASILYAVHYSGGDAAAKQQTAYAAYRARAEVAADEAGIKKGRTEWMRNWMMKQVRENSDIHQEVMDATRLFFMDYSNVPMWLDPSANLPEEKTIRFMKEHALWFMKYPYNFMRMMKRMGIDGAIELASPSSTKQERARGLANMLTLAAVAYVGASLLSGDDEEDSVTGSRYDAEGNFLDRDKDTSSRLNVSAVARNLRLGRTIATALRMAGISVNDDLTNHRGDDFWMYYRNITWAPESLLMGRLARGDFKGFLKDVGPYITDMAGLGALFQLGGFAIIGSTDSKKPYLSRVTEAWYETLSAPVNPSAITRYVTYMTDPVARKQKGLSPVEAIKSQIPGLSKTIPAAGDPVEVPLTYNINTDRGYETAARRIQNNPKLSNAEKDKAIEKLNRDFQTDNQASSGIDLRQVLFGMGIDPNKMSTQSLTTRNFVADLSRLQQAGVGPESIKISEKITPSGRTQTYIAYPDPDTIAVRDPMFSLLKIATGINIKPLPRRTAREAAPETLTPDFMFGDDQQANLNLPRQ
jgi:DNA repair protein RadC